MTVDPDFEAHTLEALRTARAMHADNVVKTGGLAVVAIGWILTSTSAREYLATHPLSRVTTLVGVVVVAIVHILGIWDLWWSSRRLEDSLGRRSDYVHPEVVRMYKVGTDVAAGSTLLALGLFGSLFALIADV